MSIAEGRACRQGVMGIARGRGEGSGWRMAVGGESGGADGRRAEGRAVAVRQRPWEEIGSEGDVVVGFVRVIVVVRLFGGPFAPEGGVEEELVVETKEVLTFVEVAAEHEREGVEGGGGGSREQVGMLDIESHRDRADTGGQRGQGGHVRRLLQLVEGAGQDGHGSAPSGGVEDALEGVGVDGLALLAGGFAQGVGGESIDVAEGATGVLMQESDGVKREQVAVAAGASEARPEVIGGVVESEGRKDEASVDAGEQTAVLAEPEAVEQIRQPDEDERQEGTGVPLVVEQDVEMVESVGVKQVSLIEEEERVDALFSELLDMRADGEEEGRRSGLGVEPQGEAELPIEVALAQSGIVAVGEAVLSGRQSMTDGAKDACFTEPAVTDHQGALMLLGGLTEAVHDLLFGRR